MRLGTFELVPHPDHPPLAVSRIEARIIGHDANWLQVRWRIDGSERVIVPPFAGKGRADGLWQATCFEVFLRAPGEDAYVELNLSPSERWAAYDLSGYRSGMAARPMPRHPSCTLRLGGRTMIFDAAIPVAGLPPCPWQAALTAVVVEEGGRTSYWALAHAPGKADFHHPACFALSVAAPGAA